MPMCDALAHTYRARFRYDDACTDEWWTVFRVRVRACLLARAIDFMLERADSLSTAGLARVRISAVPHRNA